LFTSPSPPSTSLAAGVTSWNAHDDLAKRIQRYTNAVQSVERLQWWCRSLDDIERASASNVSILVVSGEAIISLNRLAWLAAFKKEQSDKATGGADDDADAKQGGANFKRLGTFKLGASDVK